jgi:hypothetical protein
MLKGVGGERKMNAALCHVVFISVHPFGTYVSGMCWKSDAVGAAAAGMVRFGNWRGRGHEIWFERKKRIGGPQLVSNRKEEMVENKQTTKCELTS